MTKISEIIEKVMKFMAVQEKFFSLFIFLGTGNP